MALEQLSQSAPVEISKDPAGSARSRLDAIDALRGLVMVLMALDHVRDYFTDIQIDPLQLSTTYPALYFTRWITHFCAPTFVFLAGTGAFLYGSRGKTKGELSWFLISRGIWLVILEFTLVHLGWSFAFDYRFIVGQVIWAIGVSMMGLGVLVFLPTAVVTWIGIAIIAGHNYFDKVKPESFGDLKIWGAIWKAMKGTGSIRLWEDFDLWVPYPVLPWLGIMAAGYGFGTIWLLDRDRRRKWLIGLGLLLTIGFIALRYDNRYGDTHPWKQQTTTEYTVYSFLKCEKYPPSLCFTLMTLGPAILVLAWLDRGPTSALARPLVTFGRVPLFYYLLHVPVIHLLAIGIGHLRFGTSDFLWHNPNTPPYTELRPDYPYGLGVVYAIWILVLLILYPLCVWFAGVKKRRSDWWLSYL
jgi:uncharacterized membrane protein